MEFSQMIEEAMKDMSYEEKITYMKGVQDGLDSANETAREAIREIKIV